MECLSEWAPAAVIVRSKGCNLSERHKTVCYPRPHHTSTNSRCQKGLATNIKGRKNTWYPLCPTVILSLETPPECHLCLHTLMPHKISRSTHRAPKIKDICKDSKSHCQTLPAHPKPSQVLRPQPLQPTSSESFRSTHHRSSFWRPLTDSHGAEYPQVGPSDTPRAPI